MVLDWFQGKSEPEIYRKPWILPSNIVIVWAFRLKCSHNPILWSNEYLFISPNLLILNSDQNSRFTDGTSGWLSRLSAMSPLDGLMSGAQHQFRYNLADFFARISMQGILTSPSECVFCLFINIPKMKQIVEFWRERYTSITLPLICLNVLVLTGYLFGWL